MEPEDALEHTRQKLEAIGKLMHKQGFGNFIERQGKVMKIREKLKQRREKELAPISGGIAFTR